MKLFYPSKLRKRRTNKPNQNPKLKNGKLGNKLRNENFLVIIQCTLRRWTSSDCTTLVKGYDKICQKKQPIEIIHMTMIYLWFLHRRTLKFEISTKKKLQTSRSAAYCFSVTQASYIISPTIVVEHCRFSLPVTKTNNVTICRMWTERGSGFKTITKK